MKTLLISSLIAASAAFGIVAPANAGSVTITTTQHVDGHRDHRDYRHYHRRPVAERCFYKTEHHQRHGRMIVVRTKVCR